MAMISCLSPTSAFVNLRRWIRDNAPMSIEFRQLEPTDSRRWFRLEDGRLYGPFEDEDFPEHLKSLV